MESLQVSGIFASVREPQRIHIVLFDPALDPAGFRPFHVRLKAQIERAGEFIMTRETLPSWAIRIFRGFIYGSRRFLHPANLEAAGRFGFGKSDDGRS